MRSTFLVLFLMSFQFSVEGAATISFESLPSGPGYTDVLCSDSVSGKLGKCTAKASQGPQGPQGPAGADSALAKLKCPEGTGVVYQYGAWGCAPAASPGSDTPILPLGATITVEFDTGGVDNLTHWTHWWGGNLLLPHTTTWAKGVTPTTTSTGAPSIAEVVLYGGMTEPPPPVVSSLNAVSSPYPAAAPGSPKFVFNYNFSVSITPDYSGSALTNWAVAVEKADLGIVKIGKRLDPASGGYLPDKVSPIQIKLVYKVAFPGPNAVADWLTAISEGKDKIRTALVQVDILSPSLTSVVAHYDFNYCIPVDYAPSIDFSSFPVDILRTETLVLMCDSLSGLAIHNTNLQFWLLDTLKNSSPAFRDVKVSQLNPTTHSVLHSTIYGSAFITEFYLPHLDATSAHIAVVEKIVIQPSTRTDLW